MINDAADIKRTRSILELLPPGTKVVPAGRGRWRIPCPLHGGARLSCVVAQLGGGWNFHCFTCGEKGTVIDWVMVTRGLDFKTALRELGGGNAGKMSQLEYFENLMPPPAHVRGGYLVACDTRRCAATVDVEGGGEKASDLLALLCAVDHLRTLGWLVSDDARRARCPRCADILRALHRRRPVARRAA